MNKLLESPPKNYWHCLIKLDGSTRYSKLHDLTFDDLNKRVVEPWLESRPFSVNTAIVRSSEDVKEIKISHTDQSAVSMAQQFNANLHPNDLRKWSFDRGLLPFQKGTDLTQDLLFPSDFRGPLSPDVGMLLRLCERLPKAARILANRSHKEKRGFEIADEYDVQDLLHGLMRAYLQYSVQEDPLPKSGGVRSSRIDFSIEELGVLIEVKYARKSADQKRIFEELSQDLKLYAKWPHLTTLIVLVYNSDVLRDRDALKKESGEQVIDGCRFRLEIVLS